MRKIIIRILLVLLVLVAVILGAVLFAGGDIIRGAVNSAGPRLLGVPVTLADASLQVGKGRLQLEQLHVGNPPGFKTPGLFDLGKVEVVLDTSSLLADTIRIREVAIDAPEITYEMALGRSNLGTLMDSLGGSEDKDKQKEKKPEAKEGKGRVVIDHIVIRGARLRISAVMMQGRAAELPLPVIELRDIGKEGGGAKPSEALRAIIREVFKAVRDAIAGGGGILGDSAKFLGNETEAAAGSLIRGVRNTGGAVGDGAGRLIKALESVGGGKN